MGLFNAIGNLLDLNGDPQAEYQKQMEAERKRRKESLNGYVSQMKAPVVTDQTKARIKALEDESKHTSLAEDPYFAAQRSTVVQGGQQALSSVQNKQAATGTSGGFSNVGSQNDVYDRLGTQLSQLGQQSTELKDRKRDAAAQAQQSIVDAQTQYENAIVEARMAIERGDSDLAMEAINKANAARQAAQAADNQLLGGMIQAGATAFGGPAAGAAAGGVTQAALPTAAAAAPTNYSNYGQTVGLGQTSMPFSFYKKRG